MKKSTNFNLLLNSKMKTIAISFICLFYILNTKAANNDDGKLEFGTEVEFALLEVLKNENSNFNITSTNPVENFIKKNSLIEIPGYLRSHIISKEESSITSLHFISKTKKSWNSFSEKTLSKTTTTNSNQEDTLELGEVLALDFLANKKRSAAFTPTTIYTHSEKIGKLKLKAKLKSISLTVFF